MCGICGFVSKDRITTEQLTSMNDTMIHRGPDDSGVEIYDLSDGYSVGFAQRRLSIMDLSELGHQPMHSALQAGTTVPRISVVYNGEIYNFLELKQEIPEYEFKTGCDTELLIAAYLKWGKKCFDKFNGMFAVAIFDRENGEIILARDRIGKKPLYYWYESGNIVFGSELKPIMNYPGFKRMIDQKVLARFLMQQYIVHPDTIFENVYKLEPGTILTFKDGEICTEKYWDISRVYSENAASPIRGYEEAKAQLKASLIESVKRRMISDVPLGTFLSGGYDSTLVTAIAATLSDEPVKTFTIGFDNKEYNEAEYAAEVAEYLGTDHTERYISEKDMFDMVESLPKYFDEPMADSSQIPTMLVSMLAKEKVTVALSGDGGDEFYCGYNIYKSVGQAQKLDMAGKAVHDIAGLLHIKNSKAYEKLPIKVRTIADNRNRETKTQLSSVKYIDVANNMTLCRESLPCKYEIEGRYDSRNWQVVRMLLDMDTYLPGDILCKVDRASMKYSLESRCPILDKDVMELSFRIPHEYKYRNDIKKYILRDITHDFVPKEIMDRPKKGFKVPLDSWMRGPLKDQLIDYTNETFVKNQGLFESGYVKSVIEEYLKNGDAGPMSGKNFSRLCWAYFVFQQWYKEYAG